MAEPSGELRAFRIHALALSFVLLLSSLIILPSASYFFQGDSLYWLEHRYQSWSEVAQAFVSLDSHGKAMIQTKLQDKPSASTTSSNSSRTSS